MPNRQIVAKMWKAFRDAAIIDDPPADRQLLRAASIAYYMGVFDSTKRTMAQLTDRRSARPPLDVLADIMEECMEVLTDAGAVLKAEEREGVQ